MSSIIIRRLALKALFISICAGFVLSTAAQAGDNAGDNAGNSERGEQLFQLCTQCHGVNGGGNSQVLAPGIAGLPAWYVEVQLEKFSTGVRGVHPDDTGGLRMYPMSLWLRSVEDQKAVANYVASLPIAPVENELEEHGDATAGAGFFAVCSACHGADASGNQGMGAPPLNDFSDWYLYSAITKYKTGVRGSLPGDALGAAMIGMVATLPNDAAIHDVIAHIQSLGK